MSSNRRIVQGVGLFILVMGIIALATAALLYFGADAAANVMEDGSLIAQMFGIILALIGLFQLVAGIIGMRAGKHDGMLKPFTYLCALIVVVNLAEFGLAFTSGEDMGPVWPYLIYAATAFSGVMFAGKAMKESGIQ